MLGMYDSSLANRANFGDGLDSSVVNQNTKEEYIVGGNSDSASSSEVECNSRSNHSSGGGGSSSYNVGAQSHGISCSMEASFDF